MLDAKDSLTDAPMRHAVADQPGPSAWQFRIVVLSHYRRVYRMAAALLNDPAEAEDVTQETFTRFWQCGERVDTPQNWLMRVAHNACLDRLRKNRRLISDCDSSHPEPRDDDGPADRYERSVRITALRKHIDQLPEPQRSLVVLFDIRGMSGTECAQILGISQTQVKVYLHRARRRLRLRMEIQNE